MSPINDVLNGLIFGYDPKHISANGIRNRAFHNMVKNWLKKINIHIDSTNPIGNILYLGVDSKTRLVDILAIDIPKNLSRSI